MRTVDQKRSGARLGGMVPDDAALTEVLPTDRLLASGRPAPGHREAFTGIDDRANAVTVAAHWLRRLLAIAIAVRVGRPWAWLIAFLIMTHELVCSFVLSHEAVHRLLFRNARLNDAVGRWVLAAPAFLDNDAYRRAHLAHHRDELGPEEPDLSLYAGYPTEPARLATRLRRDATGVSGLKVLRAQLSSPGPGRRRVIAAQGVLAAGSVATGNPLVYPILFVAPWFTSWQVLNRLRSIAEHAGMERSADRRRTTHVVRQRPLARLVLAPYNVGWHLAHHVDIAVPWRRLPDLHDELADAGWVSQTIEHDSYTALWRALARPDRSSPTSEAG